LSNNSGENGSCKVTIEEITPLAATGMPQKVLCGSWHAAENSYKNLLLI
jgi:hypothetical protein